MPAKAYRIETERLVVRCYEPSDARILKEAIDQSLDHLKPWMPWARFEPETFAQKQQRLREFRGQFDLDKDYVFGIFSKDEKKLIGSTGLHTRIGGNAREIGYWIHVDEINKGYVTEAVQALVKVAFKLEENERLEIHCDPENYPSKAVPQKLGFTHEATLKDRITDSEGKSRDAMIWTLFKKDYIPADFPFQAFDCAGDPID